MGKSSSSDLRVRIVGEIESGHSRRAAGLPQSIFGTHCKHPEQARRVQLLL